MVRVTTPPLCLTGSNIVEPVDDSGVSRPLGGQPSHLYIPGWSRFVLDHSLKGLRLGTTYKIVTLLHSWSGDLFSPVSVCIVRPVLYRTPRHSLDPRYRSFCPVLDPDSSPLVGSSTFHPEFGGVVTLGQGHVVRDQPLTPGDLVLLLFPGLRKSDRDDIGFLDLKRYQGKNSEPPKIKRNDGGLLRTLGFLQSHLHPEERE